MPVHNNQSNEIRQMKYLGLGTLLLLIIQCSGQNSLTIRSEGHTFEDFVPENWKIIRTTTGDLNKDGIEDAALVIQEMDPRKIQISNGLGIDTLDTNPRIMMILFKDPKSNKFRLKETSKTFILNHYSPAMDDPFDGIIISKGILEIGFHFWYSTGSWYQTILEYKFRFQKNDFFLIGAEFREINRATTEGLKRSFNFSTKKMSETKTTFENDQNGEQVEKSRTDWRNLEIKELKTFKTLTSPLKWTVAPGVNI
jgi:hypothetical protein